MRAAGKHCRHPSAGLADPAVPNGEHPAMNRVKPAGPHSPQSPAFADARPFELIERDHPVLTCRDPRHCGVRRLVGEFPTHVGG